MAKAFGIVNFAGNHVRVEGLQSYRPVAAVSFLGRYRVVMSSCSKMVVQRTWLSSYVNLNVVNAAITHI